MSQKQKRGWRVHSTRGKVADRFGHIQATVLLCYYTLYPIQTGVKNRFRPRFHQPVALGCFENFLMKCPPLDHWNLEYLGVDPKQRLA